MANRLTLAIIFLCLSHGAHIPETHTLSLPNSHTQGFLELSQDQTSTETTDSAETSITPEESTTDLEDDSTGTVPDTADSTTEETSTEETSSEPEPSDEIVELTEDFADEAPGEIIPDEEMIEEEDQTPSQVTEPIEIEYEDYVCICLPESENKTKFLDGDENGDEDEIIIEVMEEDETINNSGPPFDISPECSENFVVNIDCVGPDCVITSDTSDQKTIEIVTTSSEEGCLEDIGLIVTDSTVE